MWQMNKDFIFCHSAWTVLCKEKNPFRHDFYDHFGGKKRRNFLLSFPFLIISNSIICYANIASILHTTDSILQVDFLPSKDIVIVGLTNSRIGVLRSLRR